MPFLAILMLLAVSAVLVGTPILALLTWQHLRRLEERLGPTPPNLAKLVDRVTALEARVAELSRRAADAPSPFAEVQDLTPAPDVEPIGPAAVEVPVVPVPAPTRETPRVPAAARPAGLDLETQVAGRWLNRVGLLAVVVGVAFFLKYAIDNAWIGPTGQVALGFLLGLTIVTFSARVHRRGHAYFADGLTGLGGAVLYLSLWAAGNYYALLPASMSFLAMIAVTAALLTIAVGRRSERVALLALLGGFATPWLLSSGLDQQVVLFLYLALLNAALLPLVRMQNWRWLEPLAFASTQIYFWGWYDRFYTDERIWVTTLFAVLFFVEFLLVPAARSRATGRLLQQHVLLMFANGGLLLVALRAMMWPERRWSLTLAALALAAVHLMLAEATRPHDPATDRRDPPAKLLLAGMALTFVTLAIPIRLDGPLITTFWVVEATVLMWSGLRVPLQWLRIAALALFAVVGWRLVALPLDADRFLLNTQFAVHVAVIACVALSLSWAFGARQRVSAREWPWLWALGGAANVLAIVTLTLEVYRFFDQPAGLPRTRDDYLAAGLVTSLVWTAYAAGLVSVGARRRLAGVRWFGLGLFGVTTLKVFVIDLAAMTGIYRVVSSIVLGVVLLIVSFLYQRRLASTSREEAL